MYGICNIFFNYFLFYLIYSRAENLSSRATCMHYSCMYDHYTVQNKSVHLLYFVGRIAVQPHIIYTVCLKLQTFMLYKYTYIWILHWAARITCWGLLIWWCLNEQFFRYARKEYWINSFVSFPNKISILFI